MGVPPPPGYGPGSDEMKELIDRRRADVERECQEATANPDARIQYSWLVAQRRVRDCFAGSFAGDAGLLRLKRDPNEPYNIINIKDAVVHWNEKTFFKFKCFACGGYSARNEQERRFLESVYVFEPNDNFWWKKHNAEKDGVERELKEATSTTDKVIKEYSRDEAEQRVKNCYGYGSRNFFDIIFRMIHLYFPLKETTVVKLIKLITFLISVKHFNNWMKESVFRNTQVKDLDLLN